MELKDLVGKDLSKFKIEERTEVYRTNDDGRKTESIGFFKSDTIARAFAKGQKDANWHETEKVLIMTDGEVGFLLGKPVKLLDDEQAALGLREKALAKLSPEDRELLKI